MVYQSEACFTSKKTFNGMWTRMWSCLLLFKVLWLTKNYRNLETSWFYVKTNSDRYQSYESFFLFLNFQRCKHEHRNLKTIKNSRANFFFFLLVCMQFLTYKRSEKFFWDFAKVCEKNVMFIFLTAFHYISYFLVIFHHYLDSLQLFLLLFVCMP